MAKECARRMIERGEGGKIVSTASTAAVFALHDHAPYCTSKAAINGLTRVSAVLIPKFHTLERRTCIGSTIQMKRQYETSLVEVRHPVDEPTMNAPSVGNLLAQRRIFISCFQHVNGAILQFGELRDAGVKNMWSSPS